MREGRILLFSITLFMIAIVLGSVLIKLVLAFGGM
jgi:hypothetical protein